MAQMDISRQNDLRARLEARLAARPVQGSAAQMRARFLQLIGAGPEGVACRLGGVPCVRHGSGPPVVWLHGGGYVFGSPQTHARAAHALAERAGMEVYLPAYRLAPEHRWPAPLEDAAAVLGSFAEPVAVVGDSAGGHLALALARHRPSKVRALGLISPNTDRTGRSETRARNTPFDLMNHAADDARLAEMALPNIQSDHPDASPVLADLSALPRTFVTVATDEVLLDDALMLIRRLSLSNVPVAAHILEGLWHMWPLWPGELTQADDTLEALARFLQDDPRTPQRAQMHQQNGTTDAVQPFAPPDDSRTERPPSDLG